MESEDETTFETRELFAHVLLVEDEAAHATLVGRALRSIVGEVHIAKTAQEAIEQLHQSIPDLVLCDLHLGATSGLEVVHAVKELRPTLPIVVLTASSNIEDATTAMREGAWDYKVKEFSPDFSSRLQLVIDRIAERVAQQNRELQLRAERDAFWSAAATAQDGLAIVASDGSVVFSNEAYQRFCDIAGGAGDDGVNIVTLVHRHDVPAAERLLEQLLGGAQNSLWNAEISIVAEEGEGATKQHFFDLSFTPIGGGRSRGKAPSPAFRRHVLWVRDITRRKDQEKFQRDLLSTTTHDLKGPLGAVLTCSELLGENVTLGNRDKDLVTRIASCARNSISIIDELLSARRIQDGVMVVAPKWHRAEEILEDIVLDYQPVARSKGVDFQFQVPITGLEIYADRIGLSRILGNLVSNAIKFTPKGGRVELSAEHSASGVALAVTDSGPGIESSARHKLFERYSRLDKHQEIEGTGLGLYVTKNLVEAHGGKIEVRSEVGVGTSFIVILPDGSVATPTQEASDLIPNVKPT